MLTPLQRVLRSFGSQEDPKVWILMEDNFYLRYYIGHDGRFGHEFMEFEVFSDGRMRYANNSNYKKDMLIRKEVTLQQIALKELQKIIRDSAVVNKDDRNWPEPDNIGLFYIS